MSFPTKADIEAIRRRRASESWGDLCNDSLVLLMAIDARDKRIEALEFAVQMALADGNMIPSVRRGVQCLANLEASPERCQDVTPFGELRSE